MQAKVQTIHRSHACTYVFVASQQSFHIIFVIVFIVTVVVVACGPKA